MSFESVNHKPKLEASPKGKEIYRGSFAVITEGGDSDDLLPGTICSIYDHKEGSLSLRPLREPGNFEPPSCLTDKGCSRCLKDCGHKTHWIGSTKVHFCRNWEEAVRVARNQIRSKALLREPNFELK